MLEKHWDVAAKALREALRTHDRLRMPMIHADPRINLAYALLQQGRKADAWEAIRPAYEEVIRERAIGLLLLEAAADRERAAGDRARRRCAGQCSTRRS